MSEDNSIDPQTELRSQISKAVLANEPQRVSVLIEGQTLDDDFRIDVVKGLIAAGDYAALVEKLISPARESLTPLGWSSYLSSAMKQGHAQTAAYFIAECLAAGFQETDCYERIVECSPSEKIYDIVSAVAPVFPEPSSAISSILLQAAQTRSFGKLAALCAAGMDMGMHASAILENVMAPPPPSSAEEREKADYLSLLDSLLTNLQDKSDVHLLDAFVPRLARELCEGREYPEVLDLFIQKGADPFVNGNELGVIIQDHCSRIGDSEAAREWEAKVSHWRHSYTAAYQSKFDTTFGTDFKLQDLLQTKQENGETGLHEAMRAGRAKEVIFAAAKTKDLSFDDLLLTNKDGQTPLSIAIDRGDAICLFNPKYWRSAGVDVPAVLQAKLTDSQKEWADIEGIIARYDYSQLQDISRPHAASFRLHSRSG